MYPREIILCKMQQNFTTEETMSNPICENMKIGTIGELFVQLRLLQFGIQAAPPLKDSGNDLIALCGEIIKTIQVKTTTTNKLPKLPAETRIYCLLAIVELDGFDNNLNLDSSKIYLMPNPVKTKIEYSWDAIKKYELKCDTAICLFLETELTTIAN